MVEEYIEYVSNDTYRISFHGDTCFFRQFEASRMHYYGTAMWNRSADIMNVEMFNSNINRIVEKILRFKFNSLHE